MGPVRPPRGPPGPAWRFTGEESPGYRSLRYPSLATGRTIGAPHVPPERVPAIIHPYPEGDTTWRFACFSRFPRHGTPHVPPSSHGCPGSPGKGLPEEQTVARTVQVLLSGGFRHSNAGE